MPCDSTATTPVDTISYLYTLHYITVSDLKERLVPRGLAIFVYLALHRALKRAGNKKADDKPTNALV